MRTRAVAVGLAGMLASLALVGGELTWTPCVVRSVSQVAATFPGGGGGARIQALAWSARDARVVLMGTDRNGVWYSEDGGRTLRPSEGFDLHDVKDLAFSPWELTTAYCLGAALDTAAHAARRREGLWKSSDNGRSWSPLQPLPLEQGMFGCLVAFVPEKGDR